MKYKQKIFTLPVAGIKQNQIRWDLAFLTEYDFLLKYNKSKDLIILDMA